MDESRNVPSREAIHDTYGNIPVLQNPKRASKKFPYHVEAASVTFREKDSVGAGTQWGLLES